MLQILYIIAFTILAFLTVANLVRSLISLGIESQRGYGNGSGYRRPHPSTLHPEMLDDTGRVINEPLLVMRPLNMDDARAQLDALYEDSPSSGEESR